MSVFYQLEKVLILALKIASSICACCPDTGHHGGESVFFFFKPSQKVSLYTEKNPTEHSHL